MKTVYRIPASRLGWLDFKLEQMNKRARKLGVDEIKAEIGAFYPTQYSNDGLTLINAAAYDVSISGLTPKLSGWRFLGSIEHTEFGNVLKSIPGEQMPESFRHSEKVCHHCNVKRNRKDTYLVQHDSGEYKQIGHTCVRDFTGGVDPEYYAKLATWIEEFSIMADPDAEAEERQLRKIASVEVNDFFEVCAQEILSKGYWKGLGRAMWLDIREAAFNKAARLRFERTTKPAQELARKAIDWALNSMPLESPFNRNLETLLKKVLDCKRIEIGDAGILGFLVEAYRKDVISPKVRAIAKSEATSEFKGEIGIRITWEKLTVEKSIYLRDFKYYIILFKDSRGNVFKWATGQGLLEGTDYEVTGRIKAFNEYKGVKQTVLTRCTLKEII